jgi:hypothetical protein
MRPPATFGSGGCRRCSRSAKGVLPVALARGAVAGVRLGDEVRGLVEGVGELDERGAVRFARDGAGLEGAVLPQDPPRAAEGVERGVGGGGGGAGAEGGKGRMREGMNIEAVR